MLGDRADVAIAYFTPHPFEGAYVLEARGPAPVDLAGDPRRAARRPV